MNPSKILLVTLVAVFVMAVTIRSQPKDDDETDTTTKSQQRTTSAEFDTLRPDLSSGGQLDWLLPSTSAIIASFYILHLAIIALLVMIFQRLETRKKHDEFAEILYHASQGNLEQLIDLRARGYDMDICDYDKRTALHLAAEHNQVEVVTYLIDKCQVKLKPKDWNGHTPKKLAKNKGHLQVVGLLRNAITSERMREKLRNTCQLNAAVQSDNLREVRSLLQKGYDVNGKDYDSRTPLHIAATYNRTEITELLLERDGIIIDVLDKEGKTPIDYADKLEHSGILALFKRYEEQRPNQVTSIC